MTLISLFENDFSTLSLIIALVSATIFSLIFLSDNLFVGITAIAALITAISTLIHSMLQSKQNRASIRPELHINDSSIYGYYGKDYKYYIPGPYLSERKVIPIETLKHHRLKLFNIGLGSAKSIVYEFEFDYKSIADQFKINEKDSEDTIKQKKKFKIYANDSFSYEFHKDGGSTLNFPGCDFSPETKERLGFLVPSIERDTSKNISIPGVFMDTICALIRIENPIYFGSIVMPSKVKIPPLRLHCTYKDLNGNEFFKSFDIQLECESYDTDCEKNCEIEFNVRVDNFKRK